MRPTLLAAALAAGLLFGSPSHAAEIPPHAVILQYHNFGQDTPPSTSVSVELFRKHLEYIRDNGYTVWPLGRVVAALRDGSAMPDRVVAITIDDAYTNVARRAWPLLAEFGYPFTVFVPTDPMDQGLGGYMSWSEMREMKKRGVGFESHSAAHDYMVRRARGEAQEAWAARVRADIVKSLHRIEAELGHRPTMFAYPYGEYDDALRRIVTGLGLVGFGQQSGAAGAHGGLASLPRFPMAASYASMEGFADKVSSLPLPVAEASPDDPLIRGNARPVLSIRLAPGGYSAEGLSCYLGGEGMKVRWTSSDTFEAVASGDLPYGRSRYNCTAPAKGVKRYYWYSHPWIRLAPGGG